MPNIVLQRTLNVYNVKDFGALGNGTNDDTTFIANAINAASAAGGGIVFFPAGTYLSGNQTVASYVTIAGAGVGATIIKLKNGANTDLFSAFTANINLAGTAGAGPATGAFFFGFRDLTLDGSKAGQTSGPSYPVRVYGYGHIFEHVEVRSGFSGNMLLDWYGSSNPTAPGDAFMPHWYDVMSHDCNGIAVECGGPSDQQWIAVSGFATGSHVCHIAPNCIALRIIYGHFWATPNGQNAVTLLNETTELQLTSCQIEGSDTCALVVLANDFQAVGLEIGSTADAARIGRGIQLGQNAGNTPYANQIFQSGGLTTANSANYAHISGKLYQCQTGALDEENTQGNIYSLIAYQTLGTAIFSGGGYLNNKSAGFFAVHGLTADGTSGKGGTFQVAGISGFNGFQIYNGSGTSIFVADTFDSLLQIKNGAALSGYSDNASTLKYKLNSSTGDIQTNGQLSLGQSSSAPAIANNATITASHVGLARVSPTSAVTGIILQAGNIAGQVVCVVNEATSANSVTFAASGSNVSGGSSVVIAGGAKSLFAWDSSTSLWY